MTNEYIIDVYNGFDETHIGSELILENGEIRDVEGNEYEGTIIISGIKKK